MADKVKWYAQRIERMKKQVEKLTAWRQKAKTPDERFRRGRPEARQREEIQRLKDDFIDDAAGKQR